MLRIICAGLSIIALGGCAHVQDPVEPEAVVIVEEIEAKAPPPVTPPPQAAEVHTARYTLVPTEPVPEQILLTSQIVDIQIPTRLNATVRDGLEYLLQRSGYSLCDVQFPEVQQLYKLPLPAVHYRIGPTTLASALQLIAGRPYLVEVDEISRTICFSLRDSYRQSAVQGVTP